MSLLETIHGPDDLKLLTREQLPLVAEEVRQRLIDVVSQTGGHIGAGLGVVELTIALLYTFESPRDKVIWDVGHQAYPHKVLTGRSEQLVTIKHKDGLAPFPSRAESVYDTFGVGHSSTSISAANAHRLLKLADEYGFTIVEDDVYGFLCPDSPPPLRCTSGSASSIATRSAAIRPARTTASWFWRFRKIRCPR